MMLTLFRPASQKIIKRTIRRSAVCRCLSVDQAKRTGVTWEEVRIPVPWGHVAGKFWGDKNQTPVLALHGWQDNANSFDRLIPLLNVPSVLAIDLPGHGFSSHFPEGRNYHFEEFLMILHRVLQHYNLTKVGLLSHSLGGAIAFVYAAVFPQHVKWVINYECARSLLSLYRYNTPQTYSQAIDLSLKTENQKKHNKIPAYKLSKMVLMSIRGSWGSVVSPESAMILLQRGAKELDDVSAAKLEDNPMSESDLKNLHEVEASLSSLLKAEKEKFSDIKLSLKNTLDEAKVNVEKYFADKNDDKYYVFLRDPMLKIQGYQSLHGDLVMEASKSIVCPFLSMRTKNGFLHGGSKRFYEKSLESLKASCSHMEHHEVEGTHHGHLNNPNTVAPIMNDFIAKFN